MLPTEDDAVNVDGCGVFEGRISRDAGDAEHESWIDTQVEMSDRRNEF
jgi:hypothetical protein